MQRRNIIIASILTILITLIALAALAPLPSTPIFVSPLSLMSPQVTPAPNMTPHYAPIMICDGCPTPERGTLPAPTDTPRIGP